MPDWFYRTAARPVLFALPDAAARALGLGVVGGLGRTKVGRALIDFLGHMRPDPRLSVRIGGVDFPARVGLGWRVDPELRATHGLAGLGVGCIEVLAETRRDVRRGDGETLVEGAARHATPSTLPGVAPPILRRGGSGGRGERVELPSGISLPVVAWSDAVGDDARAFESGVVLQAGERPPAGG